MQPQLTKIELASNTLFMGPLVITSAQELTLEMLKSGLREFGVVHLKYRVSTDELELMAESLGVLWHAREIKLRQEVGAPMASRKEALPFHTDSSRANTILWWVIDEGERRTPGRYVRLESVLRLLGGADKERLRMATCRDSLQEKSVRNAGPEVPVCTRTPMGESVFWMPHRRTKACDPNVDHAVEAFESAIQCAALDEGIEIDFRDGHVVLVDNQRVLHAREALQESSKRRLLRLWFNTDEWVLGKTYAASIQLDSLLRSVATR